MAETLEAGPLLSAFFNVLFEKMASKEVVDFFQQRKLNDEMLRKLKSRMKTVSGLLEDAEEKQSFNSAVRNWLDDLKDVAYDADDLLDDIAYEARKKQHLQAGSTTFSYQVQKIFSPLNLYKKGIGELQPELEKIFARIKYLLQQKNYLNLKESDGSSPVVSRMGRLTTPLVDDSCIYGRNDDKKTIIKLLLSDDAGNTCPGVVSVVGMGGIGKTTLAQLVFNDNRVKERFDKIRAWVCVSTEMDVFKLTKNILNEIGSSDWDSMTPQQLQVELHEKVKGERILIVMDDVWDNINWESLLKPLKSVARGSKILVTTRDERVLSKVEGVSSHQLKVLSEEDSWSLFANHAFDDDSSETDANLKELGKKIIRKCEGLPLAVKTIGSLLYSKRRAREWEKILESNIWGLDDGIIIPALKLSYHYLPSHLKQCFIYCAMFPKDYLFEKEELILLWIAEGLILQNNNQRREPEEIGEKYFEDLLSRSFFQKHEGYGELRFVMHDLLNDLAKSIAGEFCYNDVEDGSCKLTEKTRHLFYEMGDGCKVLEELENISKIVKGLRTFICSMKEAEYKHVVEFLPRFRRLRVLHLSGDRSFVQEDGVNISHLDSSAKHLRYMKLYKLRNLNLPETLPHLHTLIIEECQNLTSLPDSIGDMKDLRHLSLLRTEIKALPTMPYLHTLIIEECQNLTSLPDSIGDMKDLRHLSLLRTEIKSLPDSIGNLKDLRHLDIGYTSIERLPESVCGLHSLQHLSLRGCERLVELPAKISDLVNLCHLDIMGTILKSMPPQMGKLINLHTLSYFVVGKEEGSCIAELGHFQNLHGELVLRNLQNVEEEQDALKAKIKDSWRLEKLEYEWEDEVNNSGNEILLQHLVPDMNIKKIVIGGYKGIDFPNWVGDSSFSNIVELRLNNCKYCTCLPPLGQLASLQYLEISGFDSLVSVGAEFYGSSNPSQPFGSLSMLFFNNMPKLKQWSCYENETEEDDITAFPLLEVLTISNCPELEMPPVQRIFPSTLKLLDIGCKKLSSEGRHWDLHKFSSLSSFSINSVEDIESFPSMILLPPTLPCIGIRNLKNLKSLDYAGLHHLTSLTRLSIWDCPNLECIQDEGLPESLADLYIDNCPQLEERCRKEQIGPRLYASTTEILTTRKSRTYFTILTMTISFSQECLSSCGFIDLFSF